STVVYKLMRRFCACAEAENSSNVMITRGYEEDYRLIRHTGVVRAVRGKGADMMNKWGRHPSPECSNCGAPTQTVAHT
ncbi:Hypothetical predicted protein, partial [Olea europaea subsp. europaea]